MTATATSRFQTRPIPDDGRETRMADARASLLHPTGCHEPMAGWRFERSLPGADVFPGADAFLQAALARPSGAVVYRLKRAFPPPQVDVVERKPNRIVEILELGYEEFERTHTLQAHVREAARMAIQCRTSALGGHVERCPDGHIERVWYNSCGHRFCPRCAYRKQQQWLERQRKELLPVRHFHVTFTIPHAFNDLW